jgi:hypothetical protein
MRHKYRLCLADVFATQGVNEKSVLKMSRSAFAESIELNKSTPVVLSRIPKLQDYVTNHPTFDSGIRQKVKLAIQSKESLDISARLHLIAELIQLIKVFIRQPWKALAQKKWF